MRTQHIVGTGVNCIPQLGNYPDSNSISFLAHVVKGLDDRQEAV